MRKVTLAVLAGSALAMAAAPAQAAWKNYVNKQIGFTFTAPAEMKASVGTFRGDVSGPREIDHLSVRRGQHRVPGHGDAIPAGPSGRRFACISAGAVKEKPICLLT